MIDLLFEPTHGCALIDDEVDEVLSRKQEDMAIGTDLLIGLGPCASGVGEDTKGSAMPAHHALEVFYIFWVDGTFVALALKYAESVLGSKLPVTSPVPTIAAVSSDEGSVALEARQDEFLEDERVDAPKIAEGPGITRLWVFG